MFGVAPSPVYPFFLSLHRVNLLPSPSEGFPWLPTKTSILLPSPFTPLGISSLPIASINVVSLFYGKSRRYCGEWSSVLKMCISFVSIFFISKPYIFYNTSTYMPK
jgi:hypothetical protein